MGKPAQMIAPQLEASKTIFASVAKLPECSQFAEDQKALCEGLLTTIVDQSFPGALIPERLPNGELRIIVAATPSDWRRLSPVLQAFAGPTLTSFNGLPVAPEPTDKIATLLAAFAPLTTSVIRVPSDKPEALQALRFLSRARETFVRAPRLNRAAPEPTSWLLARFQDQLNMGRRDAASSLLDNLREELRLDALNLKALQIQLFATFDDWAAIAAMQGFQNMTFARRTPAVTALLLEALYQVHLDPIFDKELPASVETTYANIVRPLALPMLTVPVPTSLRNGGWRVFGLESLLSPEREDLRSAIEIKSPALGWLGARLSPAPAQSNVEAEPLARAQELVVATEGSESVDALAAALTAISKLSEDQRALLSRAEPFSSAIRVVEQESVQADLPTSWLLWLNRLSDPTFSNALDLARFGAAEWSMTTDSPDPIEVRALHDALGEAQSNELAAERTAQALPFLVAAIRRHPSFPAPIIAPIYSSLLTILVLGAARGATTYDSSQVLIEGLLAIGLNQQDYRALADDVNGLAGEGFGVDMIFWTLEVIEMFMRYAAPDVEARENLMHRLVARILAIRMRLSTLQLTVLRRLVAEFGWVVDGLDATTRQADQDEFESRLQNKRIAIYSLLEAASRQAKVALEAAVEGLSVECSADSGGSSRLRALAQNSDIFIIVWAAAKHAATDFIREHRGSKTLLYAQGKGLSSLLRALEDHFKLGDKG
jgi:hypothetical protein